MLICPKQGLNLDLHDPKPACNQLNHLCLLLQATKEAECSMLPHTMKLGSSLAHKFKFQTHTLTKHNKGFYGRFHARPPYLSRLASVTVSTFTFRMD